MKNLKWSYFKNQKRLKKEIRMLTFGEALKRIMKFYKISVRELADNSLKDERTIVAYRNSEYLPEKESAVALCVGMKKVPVDIKFLLVAIAGFNLQNAHEDIVLSMIIVCSDKLDIYECNEIIKEINKDELYKANKVKLL